MSVNFLNIGLHDKLIVMKKFTSFLLLLLPFMLVVKAQKIDLFVGTYTNNDKSEGIYVYEFDVATGDATLKNQVASDNPSFLAISTDRNYVYAVNELGDNKGAVNAYTYDEPTGKLTLLNQQPTQSNGPCHINIDSKGKHVIVSNYSGGAISVFPLEADGRLGALVQLIQHEGSGPNESRQNAPHVHSAFFSPDEKQVYVQDLGTDKVNIYAYDFEHSSEPLTPATQPFVSGSPGGGPRHAAVSTDGNYLYLVQELTATVMVFAQKGGKLAPIQEIAMNEEGFEGRNGAADIKLSPDGKFLYASNRGDANTLAIYGVDPQDGKLTKLGNQSVLGRGPRNFTLSPDGKFLLVANQNTDEVVVFARDTDTGLLHDTGHRIAVGAPVCLVF